MTAVTGGIETILYLPHISGYEPIANLVGAEIVESDTTANDFCFDSGDVRKAILEQG